MQELQANTIATVLIGPFVDKGDGVTPEEGITLAAADSAEVMKHNGTTFVDIAGAGGNQCTLTHKEKGMYTLAIPAAVISDEGRMTVFISDESVCLPVWKDFMVLAQAAWISKYTAKDTGYMDVDIKAVGGTAAPHTSGKLHVLQGDGNAITAVGPTKAEMDTAHALLATPAQVASELVTYDAPTKGELDTAIALCAQVADGWDAALATILDNFSAARIGYLDELDFGLTEALQALSGYVDCLPASLGDIVTKTEAHVVDAVWDEVLTGTDHNAATSAGRRLRQAADVLIAREETCQAGGGNAEVILDAGASAVDNFYLHDIVILISGTGVGQSRHIDGYVGDSRTATVNRDWTTNPDATTGYVIRFASTKHVHGFGTAALAEINVEVDTALNTAIPESPVAHSINERIKAIDILTEANGDGDLAAILGDTGELQTNQGAWATATGFATSGALSTAQTAITAIGDDLDNVTDGLGALKALLDTISGYTDKIDDATNGLTAIKAEVEGLGGAAMVGTDGAALASSWTSALATALANYNATRAGYLDQLDFALQEAIAAVKGIADKVDSAMEADAAVYRFTENALEEAPSGTGASAASIADAVWDELIADHEAEGSTGEALAVATEITLEED